MVLKGLCFYHLSSEFYFLSECHVKEVLDGAVLEVPDVGTEQNITINTWGMLCELQILGTAKI